MLRIKLGDEHSANEGLSLIKDEIDRVGSILLRLKDPDQAADSSGTVDINSVIQSTAHIFSESVCATHQIKLELELDRQTTTINGNPEHLKQILTNLIKNAVEALEPNKIITISTEATVSVSGRKYTAIYIDDDGPGIPTDIKQKLFSPVATTKGEGHSGLGLSIVKKLIDDMDGSIVCRSKLGKGTQFQILLPQ
ncbi:ATP-binding protein [Oceanicoccus sp. KOV_DT_Chl]|uniref:ATP-binding protein n=1 Tax=Oceanicoccus sp. KOV_DT_Chl TaxID=1904639 RepID=UPI001F1B17F2|nr:ATP-binding protein [Oceanicoccus sp. KOV_DT_Chl]